MASRFASLGFRTSVLAAEPRLRDYLLKKKCGIRCLKSALSVEKITNMYSKYFLLMFVLYKYLIHGNLSGKLTRSILDMSFYKTIFSNAITK